MVSRRGDYFAAQTRPGCWLARTDMQTAMGVDRLAYLSVTGNSMKLSAPGAWNTFIVAET